MENRLLNWGIAAALATVGLSFWWMNKSWNTEVVSNPQDFSYEMPRPKAVRQGYDISNRRFLQELQARELAAKPTAGGKAPATPPAKKDPKLATKKADAKKTASTPKKKPTLGVRVIGAPKQGLSVMQEMVNSPDDQMQGFQNEEPAAPPVSESTRKNQVTKKTAAEWKTLLMTSPTPANANDFFRAMRARDIAANDYYSIASELLTDSRDDRQKAGLYLLKVEVSVRSFAVLVDHYTDQTPEPMKRQIYAILKTYGQAARFGILSRVLYSTDNRVVEMATQILSQTVAAQGPDGQDDEMPPGGAIPATSFRTFLPALLRLAQSDNSTIAQQAQALLQSIQNLLTA